MIYRLSKIFLIGLFVPSIVVAQDYSEQSLKTLFTSQQQRQDIEGNRKVNDAVDEQIQKTPSNIQVDGVLKRRDGKNVVWVNGKNTMDSSMVDGVKVYSNSISDKNKVPMIVDGKKVYIKPGQTWSEETGVSGVGD